tara:strand:+ start:4814 stop:6070 length:1257 start_codon:yes stop_codon:yes gene_type:complete
MALRVLHVTAYDERGGAAIAASRLHFSLLTIGIESQMLVQQKSSNSSSVLTEKNFFSKKINRILSFLDTLPARILKRNISNFSPALFSSFGLVKKINRLNPDIVHLHWICNAMLSIEDISKIKSPIVWTLHDNWAFSGGCHIMNACPNHNFSNHNCGSAPNSIFKRKKKTYLNKPDLAIVSPSKWLYELARNSELLREKLNTRIPNPSNMELFKPMNASEARGRWNLPKNKKIILCGALNLSSDLNKGLTYLRDAWNNLDDPSVELVIFGCNDAQRQDLRFNGIVHFVGKISRENTLNTLYNAADLLIVPSKQENFSNTILESLSSGTPVVAFNVGGNSDLIQHQKNGYLARPYDIEDLINGINFILQNSSDKDMRKHARARTEDFFNSDKVAQAYKDMYINFLSSIPNNQYLKNFKL